MKPNSKRKGNGASVSHAACAIAFWIFSFVYLLAYQADVLAYSQHVLSGGATHYDPCVGTVIITFTLYLLHLGVYWLTRLRGACHVLTYVPSLLALAFVTSGGTHLEEGFRMGVWSWLLPLCLAVWAMGVFAARRMSSGATQQGGVVLSRPLWVNLISMCGLFLFVGLAGSSNDVFHYRLRIERLLQGGHYAEALEVGGRSVASDSSLTMLRAYALARQGLLGERLFTYPVNGTSAELVPTGSGAHFVMYPTDSLYRYLGAKPFQDMPATLYLRALQRMPNTSPAVVDYILCGYLVDGDLDRFARELPRCHAVNDSLPRHYREALTLYMHQRSNPSLVYHDDVMETDYADLQALEAQYASEAERRLNVFKQYGTTYWWYYKYGRVK